MARRPITLKEFLSIFDSLCVRRDGSAETRPFALVLGAGASRSAGVPLASEMVRALELLADASGMRIPVSRGKESRWSWVFRHVLSSLPRDRTSSDYARDFIVECISRAEGEANITHLIAASLTRAGVFRYSFARC